jgi:hypothetical protein
MLTLVDGYAIAPWNSLSEKAFTPENLIHWRREKRTTRKETLEVRIKTIKKASGSNTTTPNISAPVQASILPVGSKATSNPPNQRDQSQQETPIAELTKHEIRNFLPGIMLESKNWFATNQNEQLGATAFPSTNVLALLFQMYIGEFPGHNNSNTLETNKPITLDAKNWEIFSYTNSRWNVFFQVRGDINN